MINIKKITEIILSIFMTYSLCRSSSETASVTVTETVTEAVTETNPDDTAQSFEADLTKGFENVDEIFEISDGWSNGSVFDCTWRRDNINFDGGKMTLTIDKDINGSSTLYSGAELGTIDFYGYGMFEVTMKPIANDGVVSSFFTFTGSPHNNPQDEIDIEFLGKDTTKVQFNYFTNGIGNHGYLFDLGFDAAEDFHTYGFEWKSDSITWYVDGSAVYTATENIPVTPGKIMMNTWPGKDVDGWLNKYDGNTPLSAEYTSVKYTKE